MKGKKKARENPEALEAQVEEEKSRDGGDDENGENRGEEEEEEEERGGGGEEADEEGGGGGGGGGAEEEEDGEGEEEGGEEEEEGQEERPKLDEGFFEIEAIRRKRVRKGQLQYLIKWRGWPETANTWEPLENLQSCSDVIDAFEESLRSGKSSRKRKRKHGAPHTQYKKKQPRSPAIYNVTGVERSSADRPLRAARLNNSSLANLLVTNQSSGPSYQGDINGNVNNVKAYKQADENGSINGPKEISEVKEDNEYDPKLSELRGSMSTNDANVDKLAIPFGDGKASEVDGATNGLPKVVSLEPIQDNRRTGAKRRKSGSVKRFKKESALGDPVFLPNSSSYTNVGLNGTTNQLGIGNPSLIGSSSGQRPVGEDFINASAIIKIIKPISFSASVLDNSQDVLVTFAAMRSDGKEVVVDNRHLKAYNPHLLIDFYEQHLKYSA